MKIEKKAENGLEIISISGTLDLQHVAEFKQQVSSLLKNGQARIVFNLENLEFIDSAGLEAFLSTLVTAKKLGGFVALASVKKTVARVFEITRMDKAFEIFPSADEAIEKLAGR
ncbi:MAG: anti-sigma factor antagonist [Candidatus Riflebacteria bacterium HGW-Riflebacteria-2]|jgi:anti-sigma B factor antagonist|nr:MAG: anti-sigma factor antagonist [Candidatus Riflebacteria bacterium HGW-Riflebacteria-2]